MNSSFRDNFRYILIKDELPNNNLSKKISYVLNNFLAVSGVYTTSTKLVDCFDDYAILRVLRGHEGLVCTCFALANNENGSPLRLRAVKVSGTIKSLNKRPIQ